MDTEISLPPDSGTVNIRSANLVVEGLARGLVAEWKRMRDSGDVYGGRGMAPALSEALAGLSRFCLEQGAVRDLGADPVLASHLATRPMREWGVPALDVPCDHADLILVDGDLHVPTEDALAVAGTHTSMEDAREDIFHQEFRASLAILRDRASEERLYTAGRSFLARNAATTQAELARFLLSNSAIANVISGFYRGAPRSARADGCYRVCAGCGSLLFPDRDMIAYPHGRCRVRECREENGSCGPSRVLEDDDQPLLAHDAILLYWIGPGLGEIAIHDALSKKGRDAVLFPACDAADVGVDGFSTGIDVKSYTSPENLVRHFRQRGGIGGLARFGRRIVAVPDAKMRGARNYAERVRAGIPPEYGVEIMSVRQVIRELTR